MTTQPRRVDARDLARIAIFAALIVVLGIMAPIPLPSGVPITAQTLGVMLAGAILGWRAGALSVLTVLVLAAVGLPVLSGGRGGLGVFVGPSAGYLIGWVFGAAVVGLIVRSGVGMRWWRVALGALAGGVGVIYVFGIPVQSAVTGLGLGDTFLSSLMFIPGDLIKAAVATVLTVAVHRAYPAAFGALRTAPAAA